MKPMHRALVAPRGSRVTAAVAVAAAALLPAVAAPAAQAVAPVVELKGSASLTRPGPAGRPASFHVTVRFSTDTPGAAAFTLQQAEIFFPDRAGTNGRLFASCSAAQIARLRGRIGRCTRGSRIGGGTVEADAIQLGITARGSVALFNGDGGRSITFNIQTQHPALIDESIDAALTQLRGGGAYGEKLTLVVPHTLQEIISGVFVGVRRFDVTIGGSVLVRGERRSYLRARTCPARPMHGVFAFKDWATGQTATVEADATVRCTSG